jgi:hypothetical protein
VLPELLDSSRTFHRNSKRMEGSDFGHG